MKISVDSVVLEGKLKGGKRKNARVQLVEGDKLMVDLMAEAVRQPYQSL